MDVARSRLWRALFMAGGLVYFAGSSQHPRGTMAEMLADPVWFGGHATILVGIILMTVGLIAFRRTKFPSTSLDRWLLIAIVVTALEAVEMAVHTGANVEAVALAAGDSTPVLTTHLWLATVIYPAFGIALAGLVVAGLRNREVGSRWIAPIGLLGAAAHAIVMPLVFLLNIGPAGILFPIAALCISLWFILAGVWPAPREAARAG